MKITPEIINTSPAGREFFNKTLNKTIKRYLDNASDSDLYKIYNACDKIAGYNESSKHTVMASHLNRQIKSMLDNAKTFPSDPDKRAKFISSAIANVYECSVQQPVEAYTKQIERALEHGLELVGEKDGVILFKTHALGSAYSNFDPFTVVDGETLAEYVEREGFYHIVFKDSVFDRAGDTVDFIPGAGKIAFSHGLRLGDYNAQAITLAFEKFDLSQSLSDQYKDKSAWIKDFDGAELIGEAYDSSEPLALYRLTRHDGYHTPRPAISSNEGFSQRLHHGSSVGNIYAVIDKRNPRNNKYIIVDGKGLASSIVNVTNSENHVAKLSDFKEGLSDAQYSAITQPSSVYDIAGHFHNNYVSEGKIFDVMKDRGPSFSQQLISATGIDPDDKALELLDHESYAMSPAQRQTLSSPLKKLFEQNMHEAWRADFVKNNGHGAERFKPMPANFRMMDMGPEEYASKLQNEGWQGIRVHGEKVEQNINQPASNIHPDLSHKLNGALSSDYVDIWKKGMKRLAESRFYNSKNELKDIPANQVANILDKMASQVHDVWMAHNGWQKDDNPHLFVPYRDLPDEEKLKDIDQVVNMINTRYQLFEKKGVDNVMNGSGYNALRQRYTPEIDRTLTGEES